MNKWNSLLCGLACLLTAGELALAQVPVEREARYELVLEKRIETFSLPLNGFIRTTNGGYALLGSYKATRIVKLDDDLRVVWDKRIDFGEWSGPNYSETRGIIAAPDGGMFVFGNTSSSALTGESMDYMAGKSKTARQYGFAALIRADGTIAWALPYYAHKWHDSIERCALVSDGFYCVGTSIGSVRDEAEKSGRRGTTFLWLVKIGFDGNILWSNLEGAEFDAASWFTPLYAEPDGSVLLAAEFGGRDAEHKRSDENWLVELLKFNSAGKLVARRAYDQWGTGRVVQTPTGYVAFIFGRLDETRHPLISMSLPRMAVLDRDLREIEFRTVLLSQVFPVTLYGDPRGGIHLVGTNDHPRTRLEPMVAFYSQAGRLMGKTSFKPLSPEDAFLYVQPGSSADELVLARAVSQTLSPQSGNHFLVVTKLRFVQD